MKSCVKLFWLTIFTSFSLNLSLIFFISPAFAQYFTITKYHSDITIQKDSSFVVRETIDVKFERPSHGIYREIPFRYRDELDKVMITPTRVLSVTDGAGKAWKYKVEKKRSVLNVRIGDPKRYVERDQTYVITYEVKNAILFFSDHEELYWNVTGNDWKAPIQEASAEVILATKEKSKNLWAAGYTGSFGSKATECRFETYDNSSKFITTKSLNPGEGLTIAFGWDKGIVSPPSSLEKFLWVLNLRENWVFFIPILSLFYMINLWYRKGRDPRVRESISVMYEPPKFGDRSLTPAEVGTLVDEKLDPRDISSTIVGLAVKGYIKIEEAKKEGLIFDRSDYTLKKMKEPDAHLSSFEIELMKSLFSTSSPGKQLLVSTLKNKFYKNLDLLKKTLYEELVKKKYFLTNPEKVRNRYALIGFIVMVFGSFLFFFLFPFSAGKGMVVGVLTGLPLLLFAPFMPARTKEGASAYMEVLGFQEFMNRAEKDRLERMGDIGLFSKFLPYAIALDVADNWAEAFKGIYQEPPEWYVSPGGFRTFSPSVFTDSLNSMASDLGSAMFSTPRGSSGGGGGGGGSGGGGSSGGGFGGGGGGSW